MRTFKNTFSGLILFLLPLLSSAQQLDCFNVIPSEKVVMHLDKNMYLAEDSIWFKAFCLQTDHVASTLSKVLYVEVYNEQTEALIQQKFQLNDGLCQGTIPIPESVKTGNYFLRAYTQYMRNFSPLHFHNQPLTIVNTNLEPHVCSTSNESSPGAQNIQMESRKENANHMFETTGLDNLNASRLCVFSESHQLLFSKPVQSSSNIATFTVPSREITHGLFYVALFDANDKTLFAQAFNNYPIPLETKLTGLQKAYSQKSPIKVKLQMSVDANLSVVVRKKGLGLEHGKEFPAVVSKNPWMLASYLANSGPVTKSTRGFLDTTLMALGDIASTDNSFLIGSDKTKLNFLPEIKNISIMGLVLDRKTREPVSNVLCIASVIDDEAQLHLTASREDGSFIFDLNHLEGNQDLYVGMKDGRNKDLELLINNDFSNQFPPIHSTPLLFDDNQHQLLDQLYKERTVSNNFKKPNQQPTYINTKSRASTSNIGRPDINVELKDFIQIPKLSEVFEEIISGVSIKKKGNQSLLNVFNGDEQRSYDDPIVLLDNVPVYNIDKLMKIDASKVESIQVINSNYMLGDYVLDGLVMINTNTDDFAKYSWNNESAFITYKTISSSPAYQQSVYTDNENRSPDFRNVLYWNPDISLKKNSQSIEFYSSDMLGTYEVIVRGFTSEGRYCHSVQTFEVQRLQP